MLQRLNKKRRPFDKKETEDPIELILSDGIYAVFHKNWQAYFPDNQLVVIDGNQFLTEPWRPIKQLQGFVGVREFINEDNFVVSDGGLPCFRENKTEHAECISGKRQSNNLNFPKVRFQFSQLLTSFRMFPNYCATFTSHLMYTLLSRSCIRSLSTGTSI